MQITTQYMAFVTLRLRSATFVNDIYTYTQSNFVVIIPLIAMFVHATREREKTCLTIYIRTFCGTFLLKPSLMDPLSHWRTYLHIYKRNFTFISP